MLVYPVAYLSALGAFLALDAVWLGLMASRLYKPALGPLMLDQFRVGPAVIFYALYGIGLVVFAIMPGLAAGKSTQAALLGGLFGFLAYATYDLTNMATLKGWPLNITLMDMAWGAFASAVASFAGYHAAAQFAARG